MLQFSVLCLVALRPQYANYMQFTKGLYLYDFIKLKLGKKLRLFKKLRKITCNSQSVHIYDYVKLKLEKS